MNQQSKNLHNIVIIVIIGALIVSIGILWRQKLNTETIKQNMQSEINNLKYQLSQSQITQNELEQLIESNISESAGEMKNENILVKDNIIYNYHVAKYADKEDYITQFVRGFIEDNKNYVFLENYIFVFEGDLSKVSFDISPGRSFSYNGLEISTDFQKPYNYKPLKISYKCDSALAEGASFYYCETNNKDYLSQYEFSTATGSGFATGGEVAASWYKLYIKNIDGVNFIFIGMLKGNYLDCPPHNYGSNCKLKSEEISSKEYFDTILQDGKNQKKIKEWDEFVESL